MKRRRRRPLALGLPLLMRELSDQAGRPRHYVIRTAFATVLLLLGFLYLTDLMSRSSFAGSFAALGNGPALFNKVVGMEALGVLIFLPAMTCGAIAGEKERNTLSILLTTRLGPATIVVEKLLSRLVLIFSLLLLSLPLLTFAYALGGLSLAYMLEIIAWLAGISVAVATLSLMCSAWCGSTVSAFFMTYAMGIALYVGVFSYVLRADIDNYLARDIVPPMRMLVWSMLLPSLVFFVLTVRCLVARAFVTPRNFVLSFFRGLDVLYNRMNVVVGNIVLTRETHTLPDERPIAWRETAKKSLGTVRYLVRVLVAVELPTVFLLILSAEMRGFFWRGASVGTLLWFVLWCIAAALISVMCGSIVSGERMRQTLPVLLATPIPGDQIVRELFAGVRRLIYVLWIPFVTIAAFDYWFHVGSHFVSPAATANWIVSCVLELAVYPFLIAWLTFYLGAKIRSPLWAVLASLMAVTGAVLVPFLLLWIAFFLMPPAYTQEWPRYAALASPAMIIVANEFDHADPRMICANFLIYGSLLVGVRRLCLARADRLLGRTEANGAAPNPQPSPVPNEEEMAPA